ncbi:F-type H+-transporting ATPase subunit a [Leucobacter exalbidus]|uniref:ATP synthase subunit a n=1 Tax=Leucobacter exalbidus TaxID=662960 RepID=A0A940PQB6_9MICO|nr:F0F1 ATP synthase subunit A [Leucobacter exalbidus]MBP1325654.1 F-type H+-transporting ATPase subunit a [Leucobacter exalbidus]
MALFPNAMHLVAPGLFGTEAGGFHGPTLDDFFPAAVLFAGTPFEMNRIMIIRVIMVIVLLLLFWLGTRNLKVVPTRGQGVLEFALDFVRNNVIEAQLGVKEGRRFAPLLMSMFFVIFAFNVTGVVPGFNIAASSVVGFPIFMAIVAYVAFLYAGLRKHPGKFLKNSLFPAGVPKVMYLLVTPVEFLSTFIMRPVTLALRLLMNMLVGHMILVLLFAATNFFVLDAGGFFPAVGAGTFVFGLAFTLFEVFVAGLQAYVFTLLTALYIQLALADEH